MDGGGGERVGLGVVDHAQIDRQQTPTIDLGVAGVVSVVVAETDSVPVHSGNLFLPADSRNHSGGI